MKLYDDLGAAQLAAESAVFHNLAPLLQSAVFGTADANSAEYNGGSWAFVTNDKGTLGFWYPTDQPTYPVSCQNYYEDPAMPAKSFGAACTLVALNGLIWNIHATGQNVNGLSDLFYALRNWIFDLGEQGQLDTAAVAGFID